jgi:hypothetical protein
MSNVFMEDPHENFVRGIHIATPVEILNAQSDNLMDIFDKDWNDDGLIDSFIF